MPPTATTRLASLLLCLLLAWLSFAAPPCALCDTPHAPLVTVPSHPTAAHLPAPTQPDDCNGICACCGFHWLPASRTLLTLPQPATATSPHQIPAPAQAPRTTPFRPPRTTLSA